GGGVAAAQGVLSEMAGEEGLAAAVLTAHGFDHGSPAADLVELLTERVSEAVQSHGELVEALGGDGAAAQRADDVIAAARGDPGGAGVRLPALVVQSVSVHQLTSNCWRARAMSRIAVSSSRRSTSKPSTF